MNQQERARRPQVDAAKLVRRTTVGLLGTALLVLTITACEQPHYPEGLDTMPKAHVLAETVQNAYEENPIRFKREHQGNEVQAQGRVSSIWTDGAVIIGSPTRKSNPYLHCMFDDEQDTASLNRDDQITVTGYLQTIEGRYVHLRNCTLNQHQPH